MNINFKENESKKITINIKKKGLEIKLKSKEEFTENIIKIEEVRKGMYKFGEKEEKDDYNGNTIIEESKNEEKIDDPEIDLRIRKKPIDQPLDDDKKEEIKENEDDKKEETKENEVHDNNDGVNNNEGQKNLINIINDDNQQKKEEKVKAPYAKYNELIYLIYSSLVKSNEQKDEIFNKIQEKISELKIKNELDIKEINAIENIKKSVEFLINNYNNNKILISIHDNSRNTYSNSNRSQNQDLMDDNESYPLVSSNNTEINSNIKININPFNFILEKLFDCNCGNQKIDDIYYYTLILNRECNNLDECFKM